MSARTVIVDRSYPDVFRALALLLQRAANTRLVWDRRRTLDRRRLTDVRRKADRRGQLPVTWTTHHWLVAEDDHAQRR